MKKYKNVLLSLGFFILAPVSFFLLGYVFNFPPFNSDKPLVLIYNTLFIIAVFFGLRNMTKTPSVLGNIVLITGTIILLIPLLFYYWAIAITGQ